MNEITNQIAVQINQLENTVGQLKEAISNQTLVQMVETDSNRRYLVEQAARKPIRWVYQFDGFHVGVDSADSLMRPDEEGDCLMGSLPTQELRNSDDDLAVRIHVAPTADKEKVLRLLGKLAEWIEREFVECPKCHKIRLPSHYLSNGECAECNGKTAQPGLLEPIVTMPDEIEIEF